MLENAKRKKCLEAQLMVTGMNGKISWHFHMTDLQYMPDVKKA